MRMNRAAKRPINLSLDADLIEAARAHGLNLSAITEDALRKRIAEEDARRWLAENGEAIIASGLADLVSIVRGQIADPHLAAALTALVDVTLAVDEHAPCVDSSCTVPGCCGTGAGE